ncbi:EamA family transporter [Pseudovibrio ascidiaceicola]|uniref:EamA family transporter n=1 Tax=Pseudovibrio ascidiaceicola TaxID=285279 RepID=UPI003D36000E
MELWIPITIAAAFSQNLRSALQKHLKGKIGTTGATFIRFGFGFPIAVFYLAVILKITGESVPDVGTTFYWAAAFGGLAQIIATFLLVHLFSYRNFAVGTAYSKTEPVQAALFGFILLGEQLTPLGMGAIALGIVGVLFISFGKQRPSGSMVLSTLVGKPALIGLASAAFFGASAAFYRTASLSVEADSFLLQAAFTLVCVTAFQTVVMGSWMTVTCPAELRAAIRNWRLSGLVGLAGIAGSIGWFTAMTLQQVAYVRALAQIELVFTLAASWMFFREKITPVELAGCVLVALGGVGIVIAAS